VYSFYRMVTLPLTLGDPNNLKPPKFLHFALPFVSSPWVIIAISNLVHRLTIASSRLCTTNCSWKRRGYVRWPTSNF